MTESPMTTSLHTQTDTQTGTQTDPIEPARERSEHIHPAMRTMRLDGVTLPPGITPTTGTLDAVFFNYLKDHASDFAELSSEEKCEQYRNHGAIIGSDVYLGRGTVIVAPRIVLEDKFRLGAGSSIHCSECFIAAQLSSFRDSLSVEASTVVIGANVYGGSAIEISGGTKNPYSVLYVGENTFLGDSIILDVTRPIAIGRDVFLTQRSVVITHNIGHSILEGYENRFEPVELADRCQIGMNATIYAGARIGRGSIVASNSYVIGSIPAGKLAIGVPAKVVRDAARSLTREKQVEITHQLLADYHELLERKGYTLSDLSNGSFTLVYRNQRFSLTFLADGQHETAQALECDQNVVWTLHRSSLQSPSHTVMNLLDKTLEGDTGIFVDSTREYLRKRGIRLEPGPWRYQAGLI